jgi:hypothetical protein
MLDSKIQLFLKERDNVENRRKLWLNSTKNDLREILNKNVVTYKNVDWYVDGHESQENYQSVYLSINNKLSGIKTPDGKPLILMGGALHFSQIINGKIRVWMEYPYIEDFAYHNPSHEVFDDIEPIELTENAIEKYISLFIQKQLDSSLQAERRPIGFHPKS